MYKFSSKANFGTQSGLWTVWCNAIENTYRLYVLTKMLLDIIDCWKLTSLIIALQMVFVSKRLNEAGFLSSFYLLIWLVVPCSLIFGAKIQIKLPGHPFLASLVRLKNETFWVNFNHCGSGGWIANHPNRDHFSSLYPQMA